MDRIISIFYILALYTVFSCRIIRASIGPDSCERSMVSLILWAIFEDISFSRCILFTRIADIIYRICDILQSCTANTFTTPDEITREPYIMGILDIFRIENIHGTDHSEWLIDILTLHPGHDRVIDIFRIDLGRETVEDILTITCHVETRICVGCTRNMIRVLCILYSIIVMKSWELYTPKQFSECIEKIHILRYRPRRERVSRSFEVIITDGECMTVIPWIYTDPSISSIHLQRIPTTYISDKTAKIHIFLNRADVRLIMIENHTYTCLKKYSHKIPFVLSSEICPLRTRSVIWSWVYQSKVMNSSSPRSWDGVISNSRTMK